MNVSNIQQKNKNITLQSYRSNNTMYSIQQQLLKSPQSFHISQQNHHNNTHKLNQFIDNSNENNIKNSKIRQQNKKYKQWNSIQYGNNITKLMKQNQNSNKNINNNINNNNQIRNNNVNVNIQYKNINSKLQVNNNSNYNIIYINRNTSNNISNPNNNITNNNNNKNNNNNNNNNNKIIKNNTNTNNNPSQNKPQRLYTFHPNFNIIHNNKIQTITSKPIQNNNLIINRYERYRDSEYSNENDQNNLIKIIKNKNKSIDNSPYKQLYDDNSFNTISNNISNNNKLSNVNINNINNNSINHNHIININKINNTTNAQKKQPRIFRSPSQSIKSQQQYQYENQSKFNNNNNNNIIKTNNINNIYHKNNQFDQNSIQQNNRYKFQQKNQEEQIINLDNKIINNHNHNKSKQPTRRIPFNYKRKLSYEQSIQYSKQDKQRLLKYSNISAINHIYNNNNINNSHLSNNNFSSHNPTNSNSQIKPISTSIVYTPIPPPTVSHHLSTSNSHPQPTHYQFYSPSYSQYYPKQQKFTQFNNLFINQDNRKHSSMEFIDQLKLKKKQFTINEKINQIQKNKKNNIQANHELFPEEKQKKQMIKNVKKHQIVYISIIITLVIVIIGIILST